MENLDILYFERLKTEIEQRFSQEHTPSMPSIRNWKGLDIIYFQEDLRKKAKGTISEKSFYTYFKTKGTQKLPRIDMLNILSIYVGYQSWHDFKKKHCSEELPSENANSTVAKHKNLAIASQKEEKKIDFQTPDKKAILQKNNIENQSNNKKTPLKKFIIFLLVILLLIGLSIVVFWKNIFQPTYVYQFRDADRNGVVNVPINIKVLKDNESPLYFQIQPGQDFVYATKDNHLEMEITSPLYENLHIIRNLHNTIHEEKILLKPDDYKSAVYYYSKKTIDKNSTEALEQITLKRKELDFRISNQAVIYQVFDNDIYGIETLDKEKYITLVTTPTTSLKNLSFIDVKTENGKIVLIKFKIQENE